MENAEYVFTGWALAGVVLFTYAFRVALRTRRAARSLGRGPEPR